MSTKSIAALIACFSSSCYAFDGLSSLNSEFTYTDNIKQPLLMTDSSSDSLLPADFYSNYSQLTSNSYALNYDESTLDLEPTPLPKYLSVSDQKDWDYLLHQTYTILGLSVVTAATMTLLPESVTKWDEESRSLKGLGKKWKDHVTEGPVWDRDEHFLNYVMHPYFGGVYYTAARHSGFNEFESFLYSATMSTFFWEYGVEAFAEVPSWQDIFITPFLGSVVGEMMFEAEQNIVASGGEVLGSETMGSVSLFFLNPVGHIHGWVSNAWGGSAEFQFVDNPWFDNQSAAKFAADSGAVYDSAFYGGQLTITF
ncbi:protein of unknown function [Vibrio xiamenensis]|uniref:DUF3943 domain-containing protein n=1 Tax=Vibrio xiamenensis TaxID=861298 RepID=A0A1G7YKD5_9VIBR|nr:DUF3943 domain-containing protein [Vibrio xiamenensis]SDG96854.1 protein of unknown function [Vibrio xiamenensis]